MRSQSNVGLLLDASMKSALFNLLKFIEEVDKSNIPFFQLSCDEILFELEMNTDKMTT